ncbi:hypothetical protein BGX26_011770, partial [Mortierella sp. AD094]
FAFGSRPFDKYERYRLWCLRLENGDGQSLAGGGGSILRLDGYSSIGEATYHTRRFANTIIDGLNVLEDMVEHNTEDE